MVRALGAGSETVNALCRQSSTAIRRRWMPMRSRRQPGFTVTIAAQLVVTLNCSRRYLAVLRRPFFVGHLWRNFMVPERKIDRRVQAAGSGCGDRLPARQGTLRLEKNKSFPL